MTPIIDVWDVDSFDDGLRADLEADADVLRDFHVSSKRLWLEREASDHLLPYRENPHAGAFQAITENIMREMEDRTIRAWHYTRMTDAEVAAMRRSGIHLSTLASIRTRLDAQVAAGTFPPRIAERLFADSPFQSDQLASRSHKFWMVSHPRRVEDGGVELLLESWGGEAAYFWQLDEELKELLKSIGTPRVIEIAMPLRHSRHSYPAAAAVVAAYIRMFDATDEKKAFDLYTHQPLPADHILAVHSGGEASFANMGFGYPSGYMDHDLG